MSEAVQWLLKAIPTYVLTFGRVFVAPKTEIVAKCRGEESAVPDALVFLGVSQLVRNRAGATSRGLKFPFGPSGARLAAL
jgi:hypothetical protein